MGFLIGNSFPWNLIRRPVTVTPETINELKAALAAEPWESYWGHPNTLAAANQALGVNLTPRQERPAITLDNDGLPMLYGASYGVCWLLSAELPPGMRLQITQEATPDMIRRWNVLKITWMKG